MKVLLTGASGFVGSHIVDVLQARGIPTAVLMRPSSSTSFLTRHLPQLEVRPGAITDPASLTSALEGITDVIHCAGCTKAVRIREFYEINHLGSRNVVEAVNARGGQIRRLVHVSSLAAAGPGTPAHPAREDEPPHPVSEYGKSKLAGEMEVREKCRREFVVVRPPAVYGPRDQGFLSMFQAVKSHLRPLPSATQALSLVYVQDLAEAIVTCLTHAGVAGKTYFAASREVTTGRVMAREIVRQMGVWTLPVPLPAALLWPVCAAQQVASRITGKASLLSLQKFAELRAPGWVCDASQLERDTGFVCSTPLEQGIARTLEWYRAERWI